MRFIGNLLMFGMCLVIQQNFTQTPIIIEQVLPSMKNQEDKPASFIGKLYNILRSKEYAKMIYWDAEQRGIRILNQKKIEEIILPKYFRHNRFSSFVRQLNMYDFHKVHLGDHKSIFVHSEFDPKKKEKIHLIRRKVTFEQREESQKQHDSDSHYKDKENYNSIYEQYRSSKKSIDKNSIKILTNDSHSANINQDRAFEELVQLLKPHTCNNEKLKQMIRHLKTDEKYRSYLKKRQFLTRIYSELEVEMSKERDFCSVFSIDDDLECPIKTKKSLVPKSLKMLDSTAFLRKNTTRNFIY